MLSLIELARQFIALPSITPNDKGCQTILSKNLAKLGFGIEHLPFGDVNNLWARRGKSKPFFVFAGHTDVVPPGPLEDWHSPPFEPRLENGLLYGRGSADMKGSLAAMLIACHRFIKQYPNHNGSIGWLITSDEEGPSIDGTAKVVDLLKSRGETIDYCLVGEPSCENQLGDTIKIGRRGSLSGDLILWGKQGHVAYPHLAKNPIHDFSSLLNDLLHVDWDEHRVSNEFPATSFQISNINAGTGAGNVIPGQLEVKFNFRYAPVTQAEALQKKIINYLNKFNLNYQLNWQHGGKPFLSKEGILRRELITTIKEITGVTPILSTTGGTSDARFIAELNTEVVEFGPCNQSIHQIDECVAIADLEQLAVIYESLLKKILV